MTQPSGWYDDPQVPSQLRYWDGVVWSNNVTPKVSPSAQQSHIGLPYGVPRAAARPQATGSHGAQDSRVATGGFDLPGPGQPGPGQQDQGQWQQGGPWPAYGQDPGQLGQLGQEPVGWAPNLPATPDGVELSGWWKRVAALILDSIIISIVTLPLTFGPMQRLWTLVMDSFRQGLAAAEAGRSATPALADADLEGALLQVTLILLAVRVLYEVAFLTTAGATPGKMALGISVRLRDKPGPPPLVAVLTRTATKEVSSIADILPYLSFFGGIFALLDVLWPLWDDKKQALHDKVAATNVVVGRQPRRDA